MRTETSFLVTTYTMFEVLFKFLDSEAFEHKSSCAPVVGSILGQKSVVSLKKTVVLFLSQLRG